MDFFRATKTQPEGCCIGWGSEDDPRITFFWA